MERIRVMVTGVGGGGNGEQLVKALKMSDKKYYLIGADITPVSKGLFLVTCLSNVEHYIIILFKELFNNSNKCLFEFWIQW